ncbi:thermostable hemolysin [Xanthomonas phaseoli pv. dieffenbachiae]|uniref:thermostable hemolysin n=1 Tax=Xanthomonas phaseoli TaxID=1985254 RepID=UPI001ADAED66|nr:thermostable hemolysin [Xanthomonas phaseoli]MBO9903070.1 thermostable hemolysin [Xanthomonas phaseoli pv. dieffenbachiae]
MYSRHGFASASLVKAGHPQRQEVERFIAAVYLRRYGAQLHSFLPQLLVYRDADGALMAAVGMRIGSAGALFVKQYLDEPAESALAARMAAPVSRSGLAEVGNFAAISSGSARALIPQMTHALHNAGVRWVLFAATRGLRNTFDRLQLRPLVLAPALQSRLRDDGTDWASYYATHPQVVCGDVAAGHAFLLERQALHPQSARLGVEPTPYLMRVSA